MLRNYKGKSWRGHKFYMSKKAIINNWANNQEEDIKKKENESR